MAPQIDLSNAGVELVQEASLPFDVTLNSAPVANTAAVVTIPADPLRGNIIRQIIFGYSAPPTAGFLQIEDGLGNVVFGPIPITSPGIGPLTLDPPLRGSKNTATIITLTAAGGGVLGAIYVNALTNA